MKAMKAELKASGMSDEDILKKSCILMKAFKREDASASIAEYNLPSKQRNVALKQNGTSPKDFTLVSFEYSAANIDKSKSYLRYPKKQGLGVLRD